jgi:hypothetical protein
MKNFVIALILALVVNFSFATPPPKPNYCKNHPNAPGCTIPIDEHVILLLIVGSLLGAYFIYKYNRKTVR